MIILGRKTVAPFTDKQIELVTTFADQAVIAIENVRLFDEVQRVATVRVARTADRDLRTCSRSSAARPASCEPVFDAMLDRTQSDCARPVRQHVASRR